MSTSRQGTSRDFPAALAGIPLLVMLCLGGGATAVVEAQEQEAPLEYRVKAAYVLNFVRFTTWPSNAFSQADSPCRIGIVGDNPFGTALQDLVKGQQVGRHPIVVQPWPSGAPLTNCQVLFISRSESDHWPAILASLKGGPTLTTSDLESFTDNGGMIGLKLQARNVRFEINLGAAREAGLALSSKLLKLADRVVRLPEER